MRLCRADPNPSSSNVSISAKSAAKAGTIWIKISKLSDGTRASHPATLWQQENQLRRLIGKIIDIVAVPLSCGELQHNEQRLQPIAWQVNGIRKPFPKGEKD